MKMVGLALVALLSSSAQDTKTSCARENVDVEERYDCRYNPKACQGGSLCVVLHVECDKTTGKVCRQYKREFCVE